MTRHLDLGCGPRPRNPYGRDDVFGVDVALEGVVAGATIVRTNVALQPLPFADNHFDSASAYDFLEHVPRVLPTADGSALRFPFIELMDEIWRVLAPGGLFYASTPMAPHPVAFQDPTHVNLISRQTHTYFTNPTLTAAMYGFRGRFDCVRTVAVRDPQDYEQVERPWLERWRMRKRERRGACTHVVWEFRADKTGH